MKDQEEPETKPNNQQLTENLTFDLNCFLPSNQNVSDEGKLQASRELNIELSRFLVDIRLPNFLEDLRRGSISVADGESLSRAMHSNGINLRYLGKIADSALDAERYIIKGENFVVPPASQSLFELCESEMVARSIKWILRHKFRSDVHAIEVPGEFLASLFNEVYANSPGEIWDKISKHVLDHYDGYVLKIWGPNGSLKARGHPIVLLRRMCQVCGVKIAAKNYAFDQDEKQEPRKIFCAEDILDIYPVVKSSIPDWPVVEAKAYFEAAKYSLALSDIYRAYESATQALSLVTQVSGSAHSVVASCCSFIGSILYQLGDPQSALTTNRRALALLDRLGYVDSSQVAHLYGSISTLYHSSGQTDKAINYLRRSIYLLEIMAGPFHSEISTLYSKMANMYVSAGKYQLSLKSINAALIRANNDQLQQALCRCVCAKIFAVGGKKHDEAFKQQKLAYDIYKQLLGSEHPRTVEVAKVMETYMRKNIDAKKEEQRIRDLESEAKQELQAKKVEKKNKKKKK